jgi:NAD-dependent dihydropyrimidine dehydrogenase PreA subunit
MGSDHKHRVCTFKEAEDAIKANEKIYINDCFCRGPARDGNAAWEYCGHAVETCMGFHPPGGDDPPYSFREINQEEALGLFENWKNQGHFFRFMENESWICFCCRCGCGFFRDKEGNQVEDSCDKGSHIEKTNSDTCNLCGKCVDVCSYDARAVEDDVMKTVSVKCYGCSACEFVCPEEAITMVPR